MSVLGPADGIWTSLLSAVLEGARSRRLYHGEKEKPIQDLRRLPELWYWNVISLLLPCFLNQDDFGVLLDHPYLNFNLSATDRLKNPVSYAMPCKRRWLKPIIVIPALVWSKSLPSWWLLLRHLLFSQWAAYRWDA